MDLDTLEGIRERLNLAHMSKPALIGIAVILVMVAVTAGRLLIGTATANEFELSKGSSEVRSEQTGESATATPDTLFIHVSGEVAHPGLVEVESGSRVADAVNAAGGFTEDAATDSVNLARPLSDGEQIVIARIVSESDSPIVEEASVQQSQSATNAASAPAPGSTSPSGLVNINTASASELVTLPGIGDATAGKIVADRQANGPFKVIEDLKRVSGIGDKKFESLSGLICV